MTLTFNLLEEPFLPCLLRDGSTAEFGLREALLRAHEVAELRHASPLTTLALHRLLLAFLHAALRGPRAPSDRKKLLAAGRFDAVMIDGYASRFADRFDLFHPTHPFYQRAGFRQAEPSGVNRLAQERSRGNNAALFDHTTDDPPPSLTPAEAARLVITEQAFAIGGGKSDTGNTTHAPLVSAAAVLAVGDTLFETLWLNLLVYNPATPRPVPATQDDAPAWEREPTEPHRQSTKPEGYLDFLTWQSRTLLLQPSSEGDRVVVRRACYAQGRKCELDAGFFNPMAGYARADAGEPWLPVRFNEYRDLWRDSTALYRACGPDQSPFEHAPQVLRELASDALSEVLRPATRYRLAVFGLCTDKAKVLFWRHESLPLPLAYLDTPGLVEHLSRAVKLADRVARDALKKAAWAAAAERLTGSVGAPDADRVRALIDSFSPERLYWSQLEQPYRRLVEDLAGPNDRAALVVGWFFDVLTPAARDAFSNTLGRIEGGRNYKAAATGLRVLNTCLATIRRSEQLTDPQTKEGVA